MLGYRDFVLHFPHCTVDASTSVTADSRLGVLLLQHRHRALIAKQRVVSAVQGLSTEDAYRNTISNTVLNSLQRRMITEKRVQQCSLVASNPFAAQP
jgi:hypothetical protein